MDGTTIALIGIIISALTFSVGFLGFITGKKANEKKQIEKEVVQKTVTNDKIKTIEEKMKYLERQIREGQVNPTAQAKLEMSLEYIKEGVDKINSRMASIEADAKSTSEEIARHDENLKSLHKRVNEVEKKVDLLSERKNV